MIFSISRFEKPAAVSSGAAFLEQQGMRRKFYYLQGILGATAKRLFLGEFEIDNFRETHESGPAGLAGSVFNFIECLDLF